MVDSESDGEAERMLAEEFADARCIAFKENTGYAKAVNAGIARASGDYFLILNTDIVATEYAIDALIAYMKKMGSAWDSSLRNCTDLKTSISNRHSVFRRRSRSFYGGHRSAA